MKELIQYHEKKRDKLLGVPSKKLDLHIMAILYLMGNDGYPMLNIQQVIDFHWKKCKKFEKVGGEKWKFHYDAVNYLNELKLTSIPVESESDVGLVKLEG